MTIEKKSNENSLLYNEALQIIEHLNFLSLLAPYAQRIEVVGSVAFDLIVKKDIDIHLLVFPGQKPLSVAMQVVNTLLEKTSLENIRVSYYKELESINCAIDSYSGPSENWSFDIWITADVKKTGFDFVRTMQMSLTADQRHLIMQIKHYLYKRDLLKDGMSRKVYDAVLSGRVVSLDDFLGCFNLLKD